MGTGGPTFVSGTPGTSANVSLVQKIARRAPRGRRAQAIIQKARDYGLPPRLPLAIFAIEDSFRPWWVRTAENIYLFAAILWWLLTGWGFRNVTVGPFQIGCHWLATFLGCPYVRRGPNWNAPRSLRLTLGLIRLPFFPLNLEVAMYRLVQLWEFVGRNDLEPIRATYEVGKGYNGTPEYGEVLVQVSLHLSLRE